MDDSRHEQRRASAGQTALAGSLPTIALGAVGLAIVILASDRLGASTASTAMGSWMVLASAAVGWLGCTVLLVLHARGVRAPVASTLLAAALPWLVGVSLTYTELATAVDAVAYMSGGEGAPVLAMGIAQASATRWIGALLSAALLGAASVGLGLATFARRSPGRGRRGAAFGGLLSLSFLGLGAHAMAATTLPVGGALMLVAAAGAAGTILGGAGGGRSDRSGELAGGAAIAAGLGVAAMAASLHASRWIELFRELALADETDLPALFETADVLVATERALTHGGVAGLLAAGALVAWAARRSGASGKMLVAPVAAVALGGLILVVDLAITGHARGLFAESSEAPWEAAAGFEPVELQLEQGAPPADGMVTADGLLGPDGAAQTSPPAEALRSLERPADFERTEHPSRMEPPLALAVDRRVEGARLRTLFEAAAESGFHGLYVIGRRLGPTEAERASLRERLPHLATATERPTSVRLLFASALPEGEPDADPLLRHARVVGEVPSRIALRPGAELPDDELGLHRVDDLASRLDLRHRGGGGVLYVTFSDATSAEVLLQTAARAADRGLVTVLVLDGDVPGQPDRALSPAP